MKKRNHWIIFITVLLLLAVPVTLVAWGFGLPAQYDDTFLGELKYKVERLEESEGPRIILAGGSALAFGVDSALMERELPGYTVVNFGMYAALGTTVMLDLSEPLVRPGDIVVLVPEQQEQALSDYFDASVMWQGLDGAFELLKDFPSDKLGQLVGEFPAFAGQKASYVFQGEKPKPQGVYVRASFNEYGDVDSPLCLRNEMPGGFDANTPIRFESDVVSEEFIDRVNGYADALQERGVTVWYALCPMNEAAIQDGATVEDFYETLREELSIPIIGNPHDSILEPGWFYDTNFHLNSSGKPVYTRVLLDGIKAIVGDSSPTNIPLPVMPDMGGPDGWTGDDRDGDCFTYEERDGSLTVTGLTGEGRDRETLMVPTTWNGLPVTAIGKGAFAGAESLGEVRIQKNIHTIFDGAFSGCPDLERIVMELETPSACRVGQGLLDGTQAKVYVPREALSAYRTDYFWSVYSTRIQVDPS